MTPKANPKTQFPAQVWGLTGGIASGKSTAARIFAERGIPVVDADTIARELASPGGAAYAQILTRFGTADRAELRKIVFADPKARQDLEAILHPLIQAESLKRINQIRQLSQIGTLSDSPILYEAALLVETGRYRDLAGLIVVDADPAIRRARLIARDGISETLADQILASQISDSVRRQAATHVLINNGSVDDLRRAIESLRLLFTKNLDP
ncbi:dephospho-CoA kinase [Bdellovibrionota bacterium FG-1]